MRISLSFRREIQLVHRSRLNIDSSAHTDYCMKSKQRQSTNGKQDIVCVCVLSSIGELSSNYIIKKLNEFCLKEMK